MAGQIGRRRERHVIKYKVRKNDNVMVIKGRERGKTGKVLRVMPEAGRRSGRAAEYGQAP